MIIDAHDPLNKAAKGGEHGFGASADAATARAAAARAAVRARARVGARGGARGAAEPVELGEELGAVDEPVARAVKVREERAELARAEPHVEHVLHHLVPRLFHPEHCAPRPCRLTPDLTHASKTFATPRPLRSLSSPTSRS